MSAESELQTVVEAAKATTAPSPEIAPSDKAVEQRTETDSQKGNKTNSIPYDRFAEVVEQRNKAAQEIETLRGQLDQRTAEISKMVNLVQSKDQDARIVNDIRQLAASNPKWRDTIEKLDKALKGVEDEIEEIKDTGVESADTARVLKELEKTKAEMQDKLEDQQVNMLLARANDITKEYMKTLPEEYQEEDKRVIQTLLKQTIDWDSIENDPNNIVHFVADGFQKAIDINGTPRGYVPEKATETTKEESPEDVLEILRQADWGRTKEVERGGKTTREAIVSDGDFTKALALHLREGRGRS